MNVGFRLTKSLSTKNEYLGLGFFTRITNIKFALGSSAPKIGIGKKCLLIAPIIIYVR